MRRWLLPGPRKRVSVVDQPVPLARQTPGKRLYAQALERDEAARVARFGRPGAGRPDNQPVGARHHLDEGGILQFGRRRRQDSVLASGERTTHVVLARTI